MGRTVNTKESGRFVEAVLKALDILNCFQDQEDLSIKDIMEGTGLTRSRTMRLTGTLEHRGFLIQDPKTRRFRLGYRLLVLGKAFEANSGLVSEARGILKELSGETAESTALFVVDGLDRVVLARENSQWSIRYSVSEGQRIPLPAGAGGKLLVAFGPENLRRKVLSSEILKSAAFGRPMDPDGLKKELSQIADQGYATSIGDRVPDSWAAAAPVFSGHNQFVGALAVAGPVIRIPSDRQQELVGVVVAYAQRLSHRLGWTGPAETGSIHIHK